MHSKLSLGQISLNPSYTDKAKLLAPLNQTKEERRKPTEGSYSTGQWHGVDWTCVLKERRRVALFVLMVSRHYTSLHTLCPEFKKTYINSEYQLVDWNTVQQCASLLALVREWHFFVFSIDYYIEENDTYSVPNSTFNHKNSACIISNSSILCSFCNFGLSVRLCMYMWVYLAPLQYFQSGLMLLTASCTLNGAQQETHSCHQNTLLATVLGW